MSVYNLWQLDKSPSKSSNNRARKKEKRLNGAIRNGTQAGPTVDLYAGYHIYSDKLGEYYNSNNCYTSVPELNAQMNKEGMEFSGWQVCYFFNKKNQNWLVIDAWKRANDWRPIKVKKSQKTH